LPPKKKKNLNFVLNCCSWYKKVDYRMGHERGWLILIIMSQNNVIWS